MDNNELASPQRHQGHTCACGTVQAEIFVLTNKKLCALCVFVVKSFIVSLQN